MTSQFSYVPTPGTVYFVGAGPGAPDLITVRGRDVIGQADLILYADSLVEGSVAGLSQKESARIAGSSNLHLQQMLALMVETAQAGGVVARVHSGDPTLYGAIHEQMAHLDDYYIPYQIIPGVTAAFAVAADLKTELTVPDVVQTIILTRTAGRTTMPVGEDLQTLAAPGASLAIYLSVSRIRHVVDDLLASGGYGPETPVAVYHKVTWPDQSSVLGTLADIVDKVRRAGYTKHALILISPALEPTLKSAARRTSSHLYDKSYTHRFRQAETFQRGKERAEARGAVSGVVAGEKHLAGSARRSGSVIISLTRRGSELAAKLAPSLEADLVVPAKFAQPANGLIPSSYNDSVLAEIRRRWPGYANLILLMPSGVAVRAIAPLLGDKSSDPAVICLDEAGRSIIPLLGGHRAGANALAQRLAGLTNGYAAITTASEVQGKPALDLPPRLAGRRWHIDPAGALTQASASLVNDEPLALYLDPELAALLGRQVSAWLAGATNLTPVNSLDDLDLDVYPAGLIISHRRLSDHHQHLLGKSVLYRPPVLVAGLGCKRGVPATELGQALDSVLADQALASQCLAALATIDLKADEAGLRELAEQLGLPLRLMDSAQLAALAPAGFSPSAAQEKFNLPGVAEPCALLAAGPQGRLLEPKRSFARCTVALALVGGDDDQPG
jgi:precorrin-4 C11-methyltransferase